MFLVRNSRERKRGRPRREREKRGGRLSKSESDVEVV